MKKLFYVLLFLLSLFTVSCSHHGGTGVPDSIPIIGGVIKETGGHVESAERLVTMAKPESNNTGKKLLDAASKEHQAALDLLDEADEQLRQAEEERQQVETKYGKLADELATVKAGWGYRLQQFVKKMVWLIVGMLALHYIGGAIALALPGGSLIGTGLSIASRVVNPLGWASTIFDNLHFRGKTPSSV